MSVVNENSLLVLHAITIFGFMFSPYFVRTDAQRILYLKVMFAVTLQWVLLGGRCMLSILEDRQRHKNEDHEDSEDKVKVRGSGVWTRLSAVSGIRKRTWVTGHMAIYVINVVVLSAIVGTRQARMLALGSIIMTIIATLQWIHHKDY